MRGSRDPNEGCPKLEDVDGDIIEDTLDWYAQDKDGTVWCLSEDTAEFEDGKITTREGPFEAGVDSAQAGVIMPSSPEVGMAYRSTTRARPRTTAKSSRAASRPACPPDGTPGC